MSTPATLKRIEEAKKKAKSAAAAAAAAGGGNNSKAEKFTADGTDGKNYTSFETTAPTKGNPKQAKPKQKPKPSRLDEQVVVELPEDVPADQYIISPEKLVCFSGMDHFLTEFYPCSLSIDGQEYRSVEHYYQACKLYTLAGAKHALKLRDIDQPAKVKVAAKRILQTLKVTKKTIDQWKAYNGFIILNHASVHKFVQNADLQKQLLETGDSLLAHTYTESFFACGMAKAEMEKWAKEEAGKELKIPSDLTAENIKYIPLMGKGKNIVGVMLMRIRKQLQEMDATARDANQISIESFLPTIFTSTLSLATTTAKDGEVVKEVEKVDGEKEAEDKEN